MTTRAIFVAFGLLAASLTPSFAETVTGNVTGWDNGSRTVTLQDGSQFTNIPADIAIPSDLQAGDEVTVQYEASEDGVLKIDGINVSRNKRAAPGNPRG